MDTPTSADATEALLGPLLRDVSRAFYLTLRVLPAGVREPVGIAYLLARAADTMADTTALPSAERLQKLLTFRALLQGDASAALHDLTPRAACNGVTAGETRLLTRLPQVLSAWHALPSDDRDAVRDIVCVLTTGMEMDLKTFSNEGPLQALQSSDDLDRYTWHVAGCVGDFWTRVTCAHTSALRGWDVAVMARVGVRFGKALQLVNVLRDIPRDLRNGRCYLPSDELSRHGLTPDDLLDSSRWSQLQPVIQGWVERSLLYFRSAEQYVLAIPVRCTRLRLAALWPVLIGLATLRALVGSGNLLDPTRRVKVSRGWIYRMILLSVPASCSNFLLRRWFGHLRRGCTRKH